MRFFENLKTDRKFLLIVIGFVLATFLVPYLTIPGLIVWWFYKKSRFSKKAKVIASFVVGGALLTLVGLGLIAYAKDQEPHLTINEPHGNISVKAQQTVIKGTYEPKDRKVWVNGKEVNVSNGTFEMVYDLKEGENKIEITAGNWKRARVNLIITRELTDEEIATRTTPNSTALKQPSSTPQPTKLSQTPEQKIEERIRTSLKQSTNTNKNKIIEIRINKAFDNDKEYGVFISINADDNLSEDFIKKGIWGDMTNIYIALYKEPIGIREATIVAHFPMTDKYGNSSDQMVMKTSLQVDEAKKVNWNSDKATLSLQVLPEVWTTQTNLLK